MMDESEANSGRRKTRYDPSEFVIPAQDHQGHSERIWARVQPLHDRQADVILRSKLFPFRTKGDIIRWCFVRGMKELERLENGVRGFIQQADAITDMLKDEIYMQEYMRMFETLEKVVSQHISMNAKGEAIRLVSQTRAKLEMIEGEPHWKKKCLQEMSRRFAHLMDARPIGLHMSEEEEEPTGLGSNGRRPQ